MGAAQAWFVCAAWKAGPVITIRLELGKLNRDRIYVSPKTGRKYMSFVLADKPDRFGNDGEVLESISKEERLAGVKGEVVGNWKQLRAKPARAGTGERNPASFWDVS